MAEHKPDGTKIHKYEVQDREFQVSLGDNDLIEAVCAHFDQHIGVAPNVLHEAVSDLVHLDLHWIPPAKERPWHTVYTSGMAEKPMSLQAEAAQQGVPEFAEVMLRIEPAFPVAKIWSDPKAHGEYWWPFEWMKIIARLPHEYNSWLGYGHTIPNGDPPSPLPGTVDQVCWMLDRPHVESPGFDTVNLDDGRSVRILQMFALTSDEIATKFQHGKDDVMQHMLKQDPNLVFQLGRTSSLKRRRKFFGLF